MIPASFDYVRVTTIDQAIDLLRRDPDGTKLIAGGHTLVPTLKLRLASPTLVVDISGIEGLKNIEIGDEIRIGALTTHAELLDSRALRDILPIFYEAANCIADPQVRNRGTIGGSLANADPAADWPAVVIALNAEIELAGPAGQRRVAARAFFAEIMTTALEPDEVLTAIFIPRPKAGTRFRYRKIRHPASGYAVVGVAVAAQITQGSIVQAAIGITGATGRAFLADSAADFLTGKEPLSEVMQQAGVLACEGADCLSDQYASAEYRKNLIRVETIRALSDIAKEIASVGT